MRRLSFFIIHPLLFLLLLALIARRWLGGAACCGDPPPPAAVATEEKEPFLPNASAPRALPPPPLAPASFLGPVCLRPGCDPCSDDAPPSPPSSSSVYRCREPSLCDPDDEVPPPLLLPLAPAPAPALRCCLCGAAGPSSHRSDSRSQSPPCCTGGGASHDAAPALPEDAPGSAEAPRLLADETAGSAALGAMPRAPVDCRRVHDATDKRMGNLSDRCEHRLPSFNNDTKYQVNESAP